MNALYNNVDGIDKPLPFKAALGAKEAEVREAAETAAKPMSSESVQGTLAGRYDYDHTNSEILITRMKTKDRRIVLSDGMTYRLLVLAEHEALPVVVLRKLLELVEAGATVMGSRPPGPYGLTQYGFAENSGYEGQDLFAGEKNGKLMLFLCEQPSPELPSPNCLATDQPLGKSVSLSWRFKRAYLARWRELSSGVNSLMARFEVRHAN